MTIFILGTILAAGMNESSTLADGQLEVTSVRLRDGVVSSKLSFLNVRDTTVLVPELRQSSPSCYLYTKSRSGYQKVEQMRTMVFDADIEVASMITMKPKTRKAWNVSETVKFLNPAPRLLYAQWIWSHRVRFVDGKTGFFELKSKMVRVTVDRLVRQQTLPLQTTMTYDKENRMKTFAEDATIQTYTYDGDGQKRSENKNGVVTTLIWDGTDYLGEI